ncbi:MAG TPA: hypothetical protein VFM18_01400, partial [Methanosarcina sp.]|nr:hypothetical protein [Methanosarcina sp.]
MAEALFKDGFHVTVLFSCPQKVDSISVNESGGKLRLLSVPGVKQKIASNKFLNKLRTFYQLARFGDFSGEWHEQVSTAIQSSQIQVDVAVSFFTPRGPLYSAYKLKKRFRFKSIFDLQDPYHEGLTGSMSRMVLKNGFKRVMRSADVVFCVNKEWSRELEVDFGIKATYLPHVIEPRVQLSSSSSASVEDKVVFFYSGSLEEDLQDPALFFQSLDRLANTGLYNEIEFRYAGNESKHKYFSANLPQGIRYTFLGWLSKEALYHEISSADILCVFPITSRTYKTCIPSKFYEFCRFEKPIMIIGDDTGAFADEMGEDFAKQFVLRSERQFIERMQAYAATGKHKFFEAN